MLHLLHAHNLPIWIETIDREVKSIYVFLEFLVNNFLYIQQRIEITVLKKKKHTRLIFLY